MPGLVLGFLFASIIGGLVKISQAYDFPTPLAISLLWAGYQTIPPLLVGSCPAEACFEDLLASQGTFGITFLVLKR